MKRHLKVCLDIRNARSILDFRKWSDSVFESLGMRKVVTDPSPNHRNQKRVVRFYLNWAITLLHRRPYEHIRSRHQLMSRVKKCCMNVLSTNYTIFSPREMYREAFVWLINLHPQKLEALPILCADLRWQLLRGGQCATVFGRCELSASSPAFLCTHIWVSF